MRSWEDVARCFPEWFDRFAVASEDIGNGARFAVGHITAVKC